MNQLPKSLSLAVTGLAFCLLIIGCGKAHVRQAIIRNDIDAVERILEAHPEQVNQRDSGGNTPLHVAVQAGDDQIVRVLLQNGADIEAKNSRGETPIEVAASLGSASIMRTLLGKGAKISDKDALLRHSAWAGHIDVVQLLIQKGADVNAGVTSKDGGRSTALHAAVTANRPDMVEFLISKGADVNIADSVGHTPLHIAAESLYTQIPKTLIAHGARINAVSKAGDTPLHRAATFGRVKMVETLVSKGADVNARRSDGQTPFDTAAMAREAETAQTLRKLGGKPSEKWELFDAAMLSDTAAINRILAARPEAVNVIARGYTPVHFAVSYGCVDSVKAFLANKVDVNIRSNVKATPLHIAARKGNKDLIRLLLDHGAEINARDKDGKTPLSYLYKFCSPIRPPGGGPVPLKPEYEVVEKYLISRGATE